jgi:hypothetical protein
MRNHSTGSFLRLHYEKLLALGLTLALIGFWARLGSRLGSMEADVRASTEKLDKYSPAHPHAAVEDVLVYTRATERVSAPFQLNVWTNPLCVPETRLWCVECRRPIPLMAETCPFCLSVQPKIGDRDSDGDGMHDVWEEKFGLDIRDPTDAGQDPDGDGFTNIEEFRSQPPTNPKNDKDTPPIAGKLRVIEIHSEPFLLLFKSLLRLPDGSYKFGVNTRNGSQTHIVKIGDVIEGFRIDSFELRTVEELHGNLRVKVNKSILTLSRGDKTIPLTYGEEVPHSDFTAKLSYAPDGRIFTLRKTDLFELNNVKYKVSDIDSKNRVVVIVRVVDGIELRVVPDA